MGNVRESILTNKNYMIYFRCLGVHDKTKDSFTLQDIQELMEEEYNVNKSIGIIHRQIKVLVNEEKLLLEEKKDKLLHYSINYQNLNKLFFEYLFERLKKYSKTYYIRVLNQLLQFKNNKGKQKTMDDFLNEFYDKNVSNVTNNIYLRVLFDVMLPITYEESLQDLFDLIITYFEFGNVNKILNQYNKNKLDEQFQLIINIENMFVHFTPFSDFDRLNEYFTNYISGEIKVK